MSENFQELLSAYISRPAQVMRSAIDFARYATGGAYESPAHLKLINDKLIAIGNGELKRLIVMAPPRHGKSWLISKYFPAWYVGTHQEHRIILSSYESEFAAKWGAAAKELIAEHGLPVFGVRLHPDSAAAARWDLQGHDGGMVSVGAGGALTGKGAHVFIIEDPIKNEAEANSATQRENLWSWFQSVAFTRLEPGAAMIVCGARWHEDDLIGRLLESGDQWEVIRLPALAEDDDPLGREPGEALWPERFDGEALESIRRQIGSYAWSALYQQSPVTQGGNIIKLEWIKYWQLAGDDYPPIDVRMPDGTTAQVHPLELQDDLYFEEVFESWDLTFKEGTTSDFCVGQVWGVKGEGRYLLDQVRKRMDFPATIEAIRNMKNKWPQAHKILIEEKANGSAVLATLRPEFSGLIAVNPSDDKLTRLHSVTPQFEYGGVFLPHPHRAPWVQSLIDELISFPNAKHDDQVDALSQALNYSKRKREWKIY